MKFTQLDVFIAAAEAAIPVAFHIHSGARDITLRRQGYVNCMAARMHQIVIQVDPSRQAYAPAEQSLRSDQIRYWLIKSATQQ